MQTIHHTHRHVTTLGNLNRVALRSYAARGPLRRYADFFAETFLLPEESINAGNVQPRIYVPSEATRRYPALARAFGLDTDAILIACFFPVGCGGKVL